MSLCILASIIAFWKTGFTGIDDPYEPPVNGEVSLMSMPYFPHGCTLQFHTVTESMKYTETSLLM